MIDVIFIWFSDKMLFTLTALQMWKLISCSKE